MTPKISVSSAGRFDQKNPAIFMRGSLDIRENPLFRRLRRIGRIQGNAFDNNNGRSTPASAQSNEERRLLYLLGQRCRCGSVKERRTRMLANDCCDLTLVPADARKRASRS